MFFWPLNIQVKLKEEYELLDIKITDRAIPSISKADYKNKNSELVREHTLRARNLTNLIIDDITDYLNKNYGDLNALDLYIATEGLSFNSKGSSYLDLASYKGVLLDRLLDICNIENVYTFSPITIKAVGGCNKGEKRGMKNAMIESFKTLDSDHLKENRFHCALMRGELKNAVNYKTGVDDLVDSYFCALALFNEISRG